MVLVVGIKPSVDSTHTINNNFNSRNDRLSER